MTKSLLLFIDGSVNNQLKIGCGAYLLVDDSIDNQEYKVNTKSFDNTSSTKLELQTLLWALNDLKTSYKRVIIHTDSQNIIGLPKRRMTLEQNDFKSGKNKLLAHHELYKVFFNTIDNIDYEFVKVKGHQPTKEKNKIDHYFTLVDRAARKALKEMKIG